MQKLSDKILITLISREREKRGNQKNLELELERRLHMRNLFAKLKIH